MNVKTKDFLNLMVENVRNKAFEDVELEIRKNIQKNIATMVAGGIISNADAEEFLRCIGLEPDIVFNVKEKKSKKTVSPESDDCGRVHHRSSTGC